MAKTRSKKNKSTFGQCGDIQATNPKGQRLIDVCSIELKRGYNSQTFAHILDKMEGAAEQIYESFFRQAQQDAINASAATWIVIAKRDRRKSLIFMPNKFLRALTQVGSGLKSYHPVFSFSLKNEFDNNHTRVFGTTLDNFLKYVKPKHIKKIHKEKKVYFNMPKKKSRKYIALITDSKEDQVLHCTNCEEEAVQWNGKRWKCSECGTINDYPQ